MDVEQPGGQLPQPPTESVAVLVDQRDPAVVIHRHDRHRAEMLDDFACHDVAARHPDLVDA